MQNTHPDSADRTFFIRQLQRTSTSTPILTLVISLKTNNLKFFTPKNSRRFSKKNMTPTVKKKWRIRHECCGNVKMWK